MSSNGADFPALPPPSFPPVMLLPARRFTASTVVVPDTISPSKGTTTSTEVSTSNSNIILDRQSSVEGNILCIDETQYFWLQRTLRTTTTNGKIRAGFCLKSPKSHEGKSSMSDSSHVWEVEVKCPSEGPYESDVSNVETQVKMVAIRIEDATHFMDSPELAALSYVASNAMTTTSNIHDHDDDDDVTDDEHIQYSLLVASDESKVYIVMPYDIATSMSLLDYCLAQPNSIVPESQARTFTEQILKGLETLQKMKLCHRNLTLDSIVVRSKKNKLSNSQITIDDDSLLYCTIRNFENALRVPCSTTTTNTDNETTTKIHMMTFSTLQQQPLRMKGNWNIQFVAPELLNSSRNNDSKEESGSSQQQQQEGPFDGYAIDLWAVGVMILSMLLGNDKVFVAPIIEDRIFQQISVHQQLKEYYTSIIQQRMTLTSPPVAVISDNALDFLQQLLRYEPKDRPTLCEILQHPWLTN